MRRLIITYDLFEPGKNYEHLLKRIKSYGEWAKLGGSSYLIHTDKAPKEVRDYLMAALDSGDKLFVGVAASPCAWRGLTEEVSNWIHSHK